MKSEQSGLLRYYLQMKILQLIVIPVKLLDSSNIIMPILLTEDNQKRGQQMSETCCENL